MSEQSHQPIKRLLVANRGEIAARILSSARELSLETVALYTDGDIGHTYNADDLVRLNSPSSYTNIDELVRIAQHHRVDAVHPGYGFLSESADFARRMATAGVLVVGPGADILDRTGDKLQARLLAEDCGVPVLPALTEPTSDAEVVREFATRSGLPVMVKAVDGGGGRGIRLIREIDDVTSLVTRAVEESSSRQVFAERAAVDGFRHVEVQIVGDGRGNVRHLWERECSIQRRYQKIVELAPSTVSDRSVVTPVIESALAMARKIKYSSLGTFEFLSNPNTAEFFFLEINPRLQVEHTITESICSIDLVQAQLLLAQGKSLQQAGFDDLDQNPTHPPPRHSIQLRITAEDPEKNHSLSIGKIQTFHFPSGNGIRLDTALIPSTPTTITADFDSLLAKLILTARTFKDAVAKARRALADTSITGVTTNLALLRAILAHPDFEARACDTQWLEANHDSLLTRSRALSRRDPLHNLVPPASLPPSAAALGPLFRKSDAWTIALKPGDSAQPHQQQQQHHLEITKILKNDFPTSLSATILHTTSDTAPQPYTLELQRTTASGSTLSSQHAQGDRADPSHVVLPISGKLVEVLVEVGDAVVKDDPICVVKQMKMEMEIRAHRDGRVAWVMEAEDDEDVAEGMLAAVVEEGVRAKL